MKNRVIPALAWGLVLLCMALIFFFSSQNSDESSQTSSHALDILVKICAPVLEKLPETEQLSYTETIHMVIRKLAHATIYLVLGLLTSNALYLTALCAAKKPLPSLGRSACGFAIAVVYAISDEFHQFFVPGRSCELRDVLIDSSGALAGTLLYLLLFSLLWKWIQKRRLSSLKGNEGPEASFKNPPVS